MMSKQTQEKIAWANYKKAKFLYHVAPPKKAFTIAKRGLKGAALDEDTKQNAIFFFVGRQWANAVAGTIGLAEYALFRIKKEAIDPAVIQWDNVDEFCSIVSFYALVDKIPRADIRFITFVWQYKPVDIIKANELIAWEIVKAAPPPDPRAVG